MKQVIFVVAAAIVLAFSGCASGGSRQLSDEEVRAFVTTHMESQVGYEAAVEPYKAGLSEDAKYFRAGQSEPLSVKLDNVDGAWFYEDSVTVDILDVQNYGAVASVMGVIHFYNMGESGERSFHGTVVRDGDRLRWDRWFHQDHGMLAKQTIPIQSEVEGAAALCQSMLKMVLQGKFSEAGALSDSLQAMDPNMAMAHVGAMWTAWLEGNSEEWGKQVAEAVAKAQDDATRYYLMSHSSQFGDRITNARIAHNLASDSPLTLVNLAWLLMGVDDASARVILDRTCERWTTIGAPHNLLGYLNMGQGNMEEAERSFKMYVRLAPDAANAHDSMGDFYVEQGDNENARVCFEKALELDPNFSSSKTKLEKLGS